MNFIKSSQRYKSASTTNIVYAVEMVDVVLDRCVLDQLVPEIVKGLAEQYIQENGDMILKKIQEKTINENVIQKVIENIRKELKRK